MKLGLLLLGVVLLAGCGNSSDNGAPNSSPPVLFDPLSSGGRLLESASAENALLDAARPAQLHTIFTHITDISNQLTSTHGLPSGVGQSSIGQEQFSDVVDCEEDGTVTRIVEIIGENLGQPTHKYIFDNCQIGGSSLHGSSSHTLIESPDDGFIRGLQIIARYDTLSIEWLDGTRNEVTGEFINRTNQSVGSSTGPSGNDYMETYSIDELVSTDSDGGTSVLRNLNVRNSYRSYVSPLEQSRSLAMSGSWVMTNAQGQELQIRFDMDHPLLSDVNIGSTGKLRVMVTGGETVILETLGEFQEQVVVTRSDAAGATTSNIVQWGDGQNLLGRLPSADCHLMILSPVCTG